MTNFYTEMTDVLRVHNNCSKIPRTTSDIRIRGAKCTEVDGGILEYLF
jgi:hypothetical protein